VALHEQSVGATNNWFTPPHVFEAQGCEFDVDVASPGREVTPWIPAAKFITERSLEVEWPGFCWMNAPFGPRMGLVPWLEKFERHGNGVALVPDRTSAPWWQRFVPRAELVLFVAKKIRFIGADGQEGRSPAQGTCLYSFGPRGHAALERAARHGLGVLMIPRSNAPCS
jgi:DNA N-6-adenine-methyltransferase (Dam)